jgi:hypothetical protein
MRVVERDSDDYQDHDVKPTDRFGSEGGWRWSRFLGQQAARNTSAVHCNPRSRCCIT